MKDAPSDELLYEVNGHTGVVTFNRPAAHNALTFGMYDRLGEIRASYTGNRRNAADALIAPYAAGSSAFRTALGLRAMTLR